MVIHEESHDTSNAGGRHPATGRYVPVTGGSRSRLPIRTGQVPRYHGFVGIDEHLTESISTMAALYSKIGGRAQIPEGKMGEFVKLLVGMAVEKSTAPDEEE